MIIKLLKILYHSALFPVGIAFAYLFWRSNITLLVLFIILVTLMIWFGRERKNEFKILIYGIIIGFIVETIGTQVSGYQKFTNPDIIGIPYWLLVAWGYGFILMKRIGLVIATGSAWTQKD